MVKPLIERGVCYRLSGSLIITSDLNRKIGRQPETLEMSPQPRIIPDQNAQRDELRRTEKGIRAIIEAIKEGIRTPGMKDEIMQLEARKHELTMIVKNAKPSVVRLHPNLAEVYRDKIATLEVALAADETRTQAADLLRSLIDEVRLIPENGRLEIQLVGDLPAMLAFANGTPRRADPAGRCAA